MEALQDRWETHEATVMAAKALELDADLTYAPGTRPWAWWFFVHGLDWKLPEIRGEEGRQLAWLREHDELDPDEASEAAMLERRRAEFMTKRGIA